MTDVKPFNTTLLGWITGGTTVAAFLALGAIALWSPSETDAARSDGEAFGAAVVQLQSATTASEVDAALVDLRDAVADTGEHASDEVSEQVQQQADALERAADGFVGERSADNEFDQDLYQLELETAVDDLTSQADDFRAQGPAVRDAFWEGYQGAMS